MRDEVDRLSRQISELESQLRQGITSNSTINLNAGGIGVWIATVACAVMLGISIIGAAVIIDQGRQVSDLRDYLSAIYAQAPHLKPEDE